MGDRVLGPRSSLALCSGQRLVLPVLHGAHRVYDQVQMCSPGLRWRGDAQRSRFWIPLTWV